MQGEDVTVDSIKRELNAINTKQFFRLALLLKSVVGD
jgi:hypothetical protein